MRVVKGKIYNHIVVSATETTTKIAYYLDFSSFLILQYGVF